MARKLALYSAVAAAAAIGYRQIVRAARSIQFGGKVILITGGSRGLGLALAREFAANGARVAICARDQQELDSAQLDLLRRGADVFATACDVTEPDQVNAMVARVRRHFGHIDILVNNAGTITVGPIESMRLKDFEEAMKVHFWAPLYVTTAVLAEMRARKFGRVVNISSIGGKIGVPHLVPYSASKFALVGLSQALRPELARDGILVTSVSPGLMRTGSPPRAMFKGKHRDEYAWFSVADSMPGLSIGVRRAARQIVNSCRRGDAELIVSLPAKLASTFQALFPELDADLMSIINRLLPGPGGIGSAKVEGRESESKVSSSVLTTLTEKAGREYNQDVR